MLDLSNRVLRALFSAPNGYSVQNIKDVCKIKQDSDVLYVLDEIRASGVDVESRKERRWIVEKRRVVSRVVDVFTIRRK